MIQELRRPVPRQRHASFRANQLPSTCIHIYIYIYIYMYIWISCPSKRRARRNERENQVRSSLNHNYQPSIQINSPDNPRQSSPYQASLQISPAPSLARLIVRSFTSSLEDEVASAVDLHRRRAS